MTRQQKRAFDLIQDSLTSRGVSPTFDDLASGMGLKSKSDVAKINRLEVKLLPDVESALSRYARQNHTTPAIAAAELLREVLGVA